MSEIVKLVENIEGKFYFGIKGSDADAKNEILRAQFSN